MAAREAKKAEPQRLDASGWIKAALDVLADQGIDAVRVEPLAKQIGVTKGSFYWHFKDRDALLEAILNDWRRRATVQIIERIENNEGSPADRLRRLLRLPYEGRRAAHGAALEASVRAWARHDPRTAEALAEVDALRLRYIAKLLEEHGKSPEESAARAMLGYAHMRAAMPDMRRIDAATLDRCETILIG